MKKIHLLVGIVMIATMSIAVVAETMTAGLIKSSDFKNGISAFGVCYSPQIKFLNNNKTRLTF